MKAESSDMHNKSETARENPRQSVRVSNRKAKDGKMDSSQLDPNTCCLLSGWRADLGVWFPASTLDDGSQLPAAPAPGAPVFSSGLRRHQNIATHIHRIKTKRYWA